MFLDRLQLARQLRITDLIGVKVGHAHPHTVFHLKCADIVQIRSPSFVFFQVLGHMMGEKNVSGIATIHHSLGHVDARAGHVRPFVHVHHTTDRPAVNAHPDLQRWLSFSARLISRRTAPVPPGFYRRPAPCRRRSGFSNPIGRFSFLELLGQANNPVEFINSAVLFVNRELRVADNVEEENVRDLKLDLLFNLSGHTIASELYH